MTKSQEKTNYLNSVSDFNYIKKPFDERLALAISQKFEVDEVLAKIVASKDLNLDEVYDFLNPSIKSSLPNPFDLLDMDLAVFHAIEAIKNNKKITIFADYDVDGATSAAILKRFFAEIKVDVEIYIPDRILEGYGPNVKALLDLKKKGTDLVITVDCGTVAFEPLEEAHKAGLEIIVIDHHIGVLEKPKALAVINPNRLDESFPHKNICAATVCFLFAVAINKKLREIGFYNDNFSFQEISQNIDFTDSLSNQLVQVDVQQTVQNLRKIKEPNLLSFLDLVALGTVCDVMPLTGLNRALVAQGLKIMRQRKNSGIRALFDVANLDEEPNSYHLGFILGPRINAGGRVGKSDLGANLLATNDEIKAKEISEKLDKLNKERKDIEAFALQEAIENLEKNHSKFGNFSKNDEVIFAVSDSWHQGVIGIVASRLKDLYNKPVAVISIDEKGKGKASCRSVNGVDFGSAILNAKAQNLIIEGGGHAMAGGFSIAKENIAKLHQFFNELMAKKIQDYLAKNVKEFDIELDLQNINLNLIKNLQQLEPFGNGNFAPKFLIKNLRKINAKIIGKDNSHISCIFSSLTNVGFSGNIAGIAFKKVDTKIGDILLDNSFKKSFSVVGDIKINNFMNDEKIQIIVDDLIV